MAWHDESQTRVTRVTVTPGQIEMLSAPSLAPRCVPAGRELRAARDAHAARIPLARLPAPVFGWNTDDEPLATLLAAAGDRKSTRLNSSHGYISYAVFCLKKKKKRR